MSMTYTNPAYPRAETPDYARSETTGDVAFVPRYARTARSRKPVRTWMILAPIGAVVLLGGGALLLAGGGEPAMRPAETTAAQR